GSVRARGVINLHPARGRLEARGAAADAFVLPAVVARANETLVPAPMNQVGRLGVPDGRPAKAAVVRTVQRAIAAVDFLREQTDILVLRREDEAVSLNALKVGRGNQRGGPGIGRNRGVV